MADVNMSDDELIQVKTNNVNHRGKERLQKTLLASLVAALATLNFGYAMGYPSPVEKLLEKTKDNKDGLLSTEEFSWFNALICIGAIIGSFVGSFLMDKFGRKITILSTTFFYAPGWCLILAAHHPSMFFIGRILSGIGVGMSSLAVAVYISEIASSKYRGGLCSLQQLSITIGVFIGFLMGSVLTWRWAAVVPIMISGVMSLLMILMPETPRYDLAHNKRHRALQTMKWLRGPEYDAESEIDEIEGNLNGDTEDTIGLKDLKKKSLYQPLLIGTMVMIFQQFSGINAVIGYCDSIFSSADVTDTKLVSIIVSLVQIAFTFLAVLIVDKSGRRILLMISSLSLCACMFVLGVYYDITIFNPVPPDQIDIFHHRTVPVSKISLLAVFCVIIYISMFSIGLGPIPWMLMSELFPPKVKDMASAMVNVVNWISAFLVMKFYPQMKDALHIQGVFWFYACCSFLSFLFTLFFVPETKGKTLEEIEKYFVSKKK